MLMALLPLAGWAADSYTVTLTPYVVSKTYGSADPGVAAAFPTARFALVDAGGSGLSKENLAPYLHAVRVNDNGEDVGTYAYTFPEEITYDPDPMTDNDEYTVYIICTQNGSLNITKGTPEITGLAINEWTYGDDAENPSVTSATVGTVNLATQVTYTYSTAADGEYGTYADVVNGQAGTYYVKANIAATGNYIAQVTDGVAFTIDQKAVDAPTFAQASYVKVFGAAEPNWNISFEGVDLVNNADAEFFAVKLNDGNDLPTVAAADPYTVKIVDTKGNYDFTSGTATYRIAYKAINDQSIVVTIDDTNVEYTGAEITLTTGDEDSQLVVKDGDNLLVKDVDYIVTYSGLHTAVGEYTVTIKGKGNYLTTDEDKQELQFEIHKKTVTVTASHDPIEHGAAVPTDFIITYDGFLGGDQATIITDQNKASVTTDYTQGANTGNYAIMVDVSSLAEAANYQYVAGANGVLTVNGTSVATATVVVDLTYNATAQSITAENTIVTVSATDLTLGTDYEVVGVYTEVGCENKATLLNYGTDYFLKIKGITTYSGEKVQQFTLKKATVTIAPVAASKYYMDPDPEFTYTATGLCEGAELTTIPSVTRVDGGAGVVPGTYALQAAGAAITPAVADNYAIEYTSGVQFTINKRPIVFTLENKIKVYGADEPGFTYTQQGLAPGQAIASVTIAREPGANVGNYAINGTAFTTVQNSEAYYEPTFIPANLEITPADLTVTALDQDITFGNDIDKVVSASTVEFTGLVNGETVLANSVNVTLSCSDLSIGDHDIVITATSDNYTITVNNGTVSVSAGTYKTLARADGNDLTDVITDEDANVVNVTFDDRALTGKTWNSFILPFDIEVADLSKAFGYAIVNVLNTTTSTGSEVHFSLYMDKIEANTPFLMKTAKDLNMNTVQINGVEIEKPASWTCTVGNEGNPQFVGVYEKTAINNALWSFPNNSADGANWVGGAAGVNLKPLAAYLVKVTPSARIFVEDFENGTTVIKELNAETGKDYDVNGWYTLNGVKLQGVPTEKGIYINNGKKVVVK